MELTAAIGLISFLAVVASWVVLPTRVPIEE